jgi:hypothetical protein
MAATGAVAALFDALPGCFCDHFHRCHRVGVFKLVGSKCRDNSFQVATDSIWENTAVDLASSLQLLLGPRFGSLR